MSDADADADTYAKTREWDSLGDAVGDAVAQIKALGLPDDSGTKVREIIWRVAVWHGIRSRKAARIEFAEQIGFLARDNGQSPSK